MKTVHFIRHGETEQNAQKVWQGHTDTPLNKKGLEQAKLLSERISSRVTKVYSSDLKRASQTASFLSSSPVLRDNLREINVGDFTGMSVKDTYTSNLEIFQSLQNDSFQFPNGESVKEFKDRGYFYQCTNEEDLSGLLDKKKIKAYIGFDCTAESLHVGSLLQIMCLRLLQKHGHKPIVLLGGGTTRIGDPSGKDKTRTILSEKEIEKNKALQA